MVPVTLPAQIVLDLAATQERPLVRRALAVLDYRKQLDLDALERIAGPGIAGTARLRQALMIHQPLLAFTNGPLEDDFLAWCERWGVPLPRINAHVHGVLVDAYWPEYELVVELDGDANHSSRGQRRLDKRKELVLRHHGLTVVRYDWELVHHEPDRVHADLVGQMQRGRQAR